MGISFAISKDRHSYSDTEINADMGAACFMETLLKSRNIKLLVQVNKLWVMTWLLPRNFADQALGSDVNALV